MSHVQLRYDAQFGLLLICNMMGGSCCGALVPRQRGMLRTLEGGCKVPIAVKTTMGAEVHGVCTLSLYGAVYTLDGKVSAPTHATQTATRSRTSTFVRAARTHNLCLSLVQTTVDDTETAEIALKEEEGYALGCRLGQKLLKKGAADILLAIRPESVAAASLAAPAKE